MAESLREALFNRRMLICVFTGFSSGLPLYVVFQLIPAWLRVEGVGLAEIGFISLVQIPYTWKFLWSPIMDRYTLPFLGRDADAAEAVRRLRTLRPGITLDDAIDAYRRWCFDDEWLAKMDTALAHAGLPSREEDEKK